ncbi:Uncharacterized protein At4g04775 [Linum perenne]
MDCNIECRRCGCGEKVILFTSWTEANPGRRFWKCRSRDKANDREFRHYFEWHDPPIEDRSKQVINGLLRRLNKIERESRDEVDSASSWSSTRRLGPGETSTVRVNEDLVRKYSMLIRGIKCLFVICMVLLGIGIGKVM